MASNWTTSTQVPETQIFTGPFLIAVGQPTKPVSLRTLGRSLRQSDTFANPLGCPPHMPENASFALAIPRRSKRSKVDKDGYGSILESTRTQSWPIKRIDPLSNQSRGIDGYFSRKKAWQVWDQAESLVFGSYMYQIRRIGQVRAQVQACSCFPAFCVFPFPRADFIIRETLARLTRVWIILGAREKVLDSWAIGCPFMYYSHYKTSTILFRLSEDRVSNWFSIGPNMWLSTYAILYKL